MRRANLDPDLLIKAVAASLAAALQVLALAILSVDAPWHRYGEDIAFVVDLLPDAGGPPVAAAPQDEVAGVAARPEIPMPELDFEPGITMPSIEAQAQDGPGASSAALKLHVRPEDAPDVAPLDYVTPPDPVYPALSRRNREEGTVWLRVLVDAEGTTVSATIVESSGHLRLDQAALQAMARARFEPHREEGRAAPAYVTVPVRFKLGD